LNEKDPSESGIERTVNKVGGRSKWRDCGTTSDKIGEFPWRPVTKK